MPVLLMINIREAQPGFHCRQPIIPWRPAAALMGRMIRLPGTLQEIGIPHLMICTVKDPRDLTCPRRRMS
eukprot:13733-Hanusia_phi.AAC.1